MKARAAMTNRQLTSAPRTNEHESRRGTALVEMALVLPIFMMVTLGIVEFGRAMMVSQLVTNAAREGARQAIIDGSNNANVRSTIETFMQQSANVAAGDLVITITVTPAPGNTDPANQVANTSSGDLIQIMIDVPFNKVSFIPGNYLKDKHLRGMAAMRRE
ncbi:TadE/TadG family type IV pilus assembly protein [Thalassoroseus pseudoceratinae]|uniref:TadE/TadG family type IV pilus assembly protein n=1 Tax=Thalassoroseus pseudoceratinae TaxID=2713176 RepID=UPI0014227CD0|nr:TadE/TadG family type IV pilus assembly protein [Thalassoroseus pseudoceratinae]